ncbi:MAG: hypothetical protein A3F91_09695 [Flavobacteria bacterium RIFCSPLOWO2_12_FULL_35_11]|nr:MAG: hypothetical protein A3F91_09695 [Flavobacteria bacterium RIFCSPLOWO2_12_FULL_35_11]
MLDNKIILEKLNIKKESKFYEYFSKYSGFDNEQEGYDEVYSLDEILADNDSDCYWCDEFPDIQKKYLKISSIEGEGSYFYSISDDAVYDVSWNEMDDLMSGNLKPRWESFSSFERELNGES